VSLRPILACLVGAALALTASPVRGDDAGRGLALRRLLEGRAEEGRASGTPALLAFYRLRDFAPAWDPGDPGAAERARILLDALARAGDHGLEPTAYRVDALPRPAGDPMLARDLSLTDALLRYARDVRVGRVRPAEVEADWAIPPPAFDAPSEAARALASGRFAAWLATLPPAQPGYRRLVEALRRHRDLARRGGGAAPGPGPLLRPGSRDDDVPRLRARLAVEEPGLSAAPASPLYDPALEAAVRRFQARHGLLVDGVVGPATRRALGVPLPERVRQIELNLERWRWLPRDLGERYLAVNAAAATLEVVEGGRVVLASRVVVGEPRYPTPVFQAWIRAVVLNPPWTVPASIVAREILPELRRDPGYLADNEIAILDRLDSDPYGQAIDWSSVPAGGPLPRLQQRPGPRNPLGRIKFDLPNPFDVYLHDSPATALFAEPIRTRSHGCVRVDRAVDLATHLLAGQDPGDRDAVEGAIATGETRRVPLARAVPVYFVYWTAFVEDGTLQFRDDPYGRDRRLARALAGSAAATPTSRAGGVGCPG
jgi:murein L,D-transpeptidase YcbB/YkuD